jgi:hypothetical protein
MLSFCFWSKIKRTGMSMDCQTLRYPFYCVCLETVFSTSAVLENCKSTHFTIDLRKIMPFLLSLLIKDKATDKCCYFKLLHAKITDTLPNFYHLLSNIIDLFQKQLCLIIYYTYNFEKILKSSMSVSQQTLLNLNRKKSKRYVTNRYVTRYFV